MVPPEPHRLVADIDAALEKNILDLAHQQRTPDVHHYREANNLGPRVEISEWVYNPTRLKRSLACLKLFCSDAVPLFHKVTD